MSVEVHDSEVNKLEVVFSDLVGGIHKQDVVILTNKVLLIAIHEEQSSKSAVYHIAFEPESV